MSQISPPLRILLVSVLALLAAWTLFLRPQPEAPPPAAEPANAGGATAQSAAGRAVEQAREAARATEARAAKVAGEAEPAAAPNAAGRTAAAPGAAAPKRANTPGGLPARVKTAIDDRRVLVLLFWSPRAADDRAVRRELAAVDRHRGKVVVHAAPMKRFARYERITRGAAVEQSPTVVVVDRKRKVDTLVGYADSGSIDQLVADARRGF